MSMKRDNDEQTTETMLATVSSAALEHWSDDRRKEFVATFEDRVAVSQWLLYHTAQYFRTTAVERSFVSSRHNRLFEDYPAAPSRWESTVGGRSITELRVLAKERAGELCKQLPPLKKAVQIIDASLAKQIDKCEALEKQAKAVAVELDELPTEIDMSDVDQKMTVGAFRAHVKDIVEKREDAYDRCAKLAKQIQELRKGIDKALYKGLPGLSDAVIDVHNQYIERATVLDQVKRRVKETVMFGDSEAALEILRSFEKDEMSISGDIIERFKQGLAQLRLTRKGRRAKVSS